MCPVRIEPLNPEPSVITVRAVILRTACKVKRQNWKSVAADADYSQQQLLVSFPAWTVAYRSFTESVESPFERASYITELTFRNRMEIKSSPGFIDNQKRVYSTSCLWGKDLSRGGRVSGRLFICYSSFQHLKSKWATLAK
jgi:hypothetical protein